MTIINEICPICGSLDYGCCPSVAIDGPWLCRKPQPIKKKDFGEELSDMIKAGYGKNL